MKKLHQISFIIAGILCCFASTKVKAQSSQAPYNFSYTTGNSYSTLTNATLLVDSTSDWGNDTVSVQLPFNFVMNGDTTNKLIIELDEAIVYLSDSDYEASQGPSIAVASAEWINNGDATVNYEITGSTGARIFKLSFNNFSSDEDDADTIRANFQLWLYEGTNKIEFHFGTSNFPPNFFNLSSADNADVLTSGLLYSYVENSTSDSVNMNVQIIKFQNNTFQSTYYNNVSFSENEESGLDTNLNAVALQTYPPNGVTFVFSPNAPTTGTSNIWASSAKFFPNPTIDVLNIQFKTPPDFGTQINIINAIGQTIKTVAVKDQNMQVDVSGLSAGIYWANISNKSGNYVYKFVVNK